MKDVSEKQGLLLQATALGWCNSFNQTSSGYSHGGDKRLYRISQTLYPSDIWRIQPSFFPPFFLFFEVDSYSHQLNGKSDYL